MNLREQHFMAQARDRFINEQTFGFRNAKGVYQPPVSRSTAQRRWLANKPRIAAAMKDQEVRKKLSLDL